MRHGTAVAHVVDVDAAARLMKALAAQGHDEPRMQCPELADRSSVLGLLANTHSELLARLAAANLQHHRGLGQVAAAARDRLVGDPGLMRELRYIDIAYGVVRHFDVCVASGVLGRLRRALAQPCVQPGVVSPRPPQQWLAAAPKVPELAVVPPAPDLFDLFSQSGNTEAPPCEYAEDGVGTDDSSYDDPDELCHVPESLISAPVSMPIMKESAEQRMVATEVEEDAQADRELLRNAGMQGVGAIEDPGKEVDQRQAKDAGTIGGLDMNVPLILDEPAAAAMPQREATVDAGAIDGFNMNVSLILDEPAAAAMPQR